MSLENIKHMDTMHFLFKYGLNSAQKLLKVSTEGFTHFHVGMGVLVNNSLETSENIKNFSDKKMVNLSQLRTDVDAFQRIQSFGSVSGVLKFLASKQDDEFLELRQALSRVSEYAAKFPDLNMSKSVNE